MDKRMIDADAFLKKISDSFDRRCSFEDIHLFYYDVIEAFDESTVSTSQESIFDADGWCWGMDLIPKDCKRILLACEYGISVGWRLKDGSIESEFTKLHRGYPADWIAWRPLPTIPTREKL